MADTKTIVTFPAYLSDPAFKNRTLTINIVKPATLGDTAQKLIDTVSEKYKETKSAFENMTSGSTAKEVVTSIQTNHQKDSKNDETVFTIVLPLPNSLRDSQGHEWATERGLIGTMGEQLESTTLGQLGDKIGGLFGSWGKNIASTITGTTGVSNINMSKALGAASNAAGMRKPLIDPGYFQNYTGTRPRTFDFDFDLIPNSPEEALDMLLLILKLKEYSSPESTIDGVSLLAPHYFDIEIGNEYISGLANLRGVVLTNISIDYGADGAMQYLPDGIPKYIKMTLSFTERKMMVASNYRKSIAKGKV